MSDNPSALPPFVKSANFPFEGQLRVKRLDPPVADEPAREGLDPSECVACGTPDAAYIWVSERWRVRAMDRPGGLPMVLILESRSHLDLGDIPNLLAAELGVMTVRLERAIRSLDGVASVHVNRWADGPAHLHLWFLARPAGRLQLRGTFLSMWDDILERVNETRWQEDLALVAAWLGEFGGRVLAEPPRIDWHAPSTFGEPSAQSTVTTAADTPAAHIATADSPEGAEAAEAAAHESNNDSYGTAGPAPTGQSGSATQPGPSAQAGPAGNSVPTTQAGPIAHGVASVPTGPTAHGVASVPGSGATPPPPTVQTPATQAAQTPVGMPAPTPGTGTGQPPATANATGQIAVPVNSTGQVAAPAPGTITGRATATAVGSAPPPGIASGDGTVMAQDATTTQGFSPAQSATTVHATTTAQSATTVQGTPLGLGVTVGQPAPAAQHVEPAAGQHPGAAQNGAVRSHNHDESMDFLNEIADGDDNFDFASDARASAV